jgi:hypothetical protein
MAVRKNNAFDVNTVLNSIDTIFKTVSMGIIYTGPTPNEHLRHNGVSDKRLNSEQGGNIYIVYSR